MNASIEKEKIEIIKWVVGLKDGAAFEQLKQLKANPTKLDWSVQVSEKEIAAIDLGLADIKAGRVKSHKVVKKLYEKWL